MGQTNNSNDMKEVINTNGFFTPFVRKGISTRITQSDELGNDSNSDSLYRQRAIIDVTAKIASGMSEQEFLPEDKEGVASLTAITPESKQIAIAGPGDILSINSNAVMNVSPAAGTEGFSSDYLPYIEFWDPDFTWRYTPAAPKGDKLRPWIALVVCDSSKCEIQNSGNGNKIVTFKITKDEYPAIFPQKEDIWKAAHAQTDSGKNARFCRLLGTRREGVPLDGNTNYTAVVIPVFEVGRRRGIGFSSEKLKDVIAQAPSWENTFDEQTEGDKHPSPLTFPVYYTWNFKTGTYSFDTLVENLDVYEASKTGIDVDVTSLGKGLENQSATKTILMPAATKVPTNDPKLKNPDSFPDPKRQDENELYGRLFRLLSRSPVFAENKQDISESKNENEQENDDPWVVPPIYGGKHSMATSLGHKDSPEWVRQVNLDLHYRAVAGLGKKTIQKHQEEFVNRAWKQVEAIQALNRTLYQRILSIGVNKSVKGMNYEWMNQNENAFIAGFMQRLSTMQNTKSGSNGKSLNDILNDKGIPAAFASATFQRVTDRLAQKFKNLNLTTMMENIAAHQIFNDEWHTFYNLPTVEQLATTKEALLSKISDFIVGNVLGNYLKVCKGSCKDWKHFYGILPKDGLNAGINQYNNHFCSYLDYSDKYTWGRPEKGDIYTNFENSSWFEKVKDLDSTACCSLNKVDESYITESAYSSHIALYYDVVWGLPDTMYEKLFGCEKLITYMPYNTNYSKGFYFVSKGKAKKDDRYKNVLQYLYDVPTSSYGYHQYETLTESQIQDPNFECETTLGKGHRIETTSSLKTEGYASGKLFYVKKTTGSRDERKWKRKISSFVIKHFNNKNGRDLYACIHITNPGSPEICKYIRLTNYEQTISLNSFNIKNNAEIWLECGKLYDYFSDIQEYNGFAARDTFIYASSASEEAKYEYNVNEKKLYYYKPAKWKRKLSDSYHYKFYKPDESYYNVVEEGDNLEYDVLELQDTTSESGIRPGVKDKIIKILSSNPDRINLTIDSSSNDIQKFETAYDYVKFLINNGMLNEFANITNAPIYASWLQLDKFVKELEELSPAKAEEAPEQDQDSCKDIDDLKKDVLDDQTYNRIWEVASGYYKEFFSNKELQDKYIEDLLQSRYPIMAYPIFPEPVYYYLKQFSDKFILPCIEDIPNNSVAMFENNTAFVEAYLCGMNTEMGRELLWREYPTDQRGSYFKKFWDSETDVESIRKDDFFDVKSLHTWTNNLGKNHCAGKDGLLLFAIKGDLVKLYPYTEIFLHKAKASVKTDGTITFSFADNVDNAAIIKPVSEAYIKDVLIVGFKISLAEALGSPEGPNQGYLLAFKQVVEDLAFKEKARSDAEFGDTSAGYANAHLDTPSTIGRHVLTFLKKN